MLSLMLHMRVLRVLLLPSLLLLLCLQPLLLSPSSRLCQLVDVLLLRRLMVCLVTLLLLL